MTALSTTGQRAGVADGHPLRAHRGQRTVLRAAEAGCAASGKTHVDDNVDLPNPAAATRPLLSLRTVVLLGGASEYARLSTTGPRAEPMLAHGAGELMERP